MSGYLIDTNCVSELIRPAPNPQVTKWFYSVSDYSLFLSVLTLGEIRRGIANLPQGKRRAGLDIWIETVLKPRYAGRILPIDDAVAEQWGILAASAKKSGQPLGTIDGLIAATALNYELTVVTRNVDDFRHTNVTLFNPWQHH
jgi:predicted nucleic acid-binding protein